MKKIFQYALTSAVSTALYVVLVVLFVFFMEKNVFDGNVNILAPVVMLLLFVFSASFTALLMFGRPVIWYLEGNRKDSFKLIFATMIIFFLILITAIAVLLIII